MVAANSGRRRVLLKRLAATVISTAIADRALRVEPAAASGDPAITLPRAGDLLVYANGDKLGGLVKYDDLVLDTQPVFAFPKDPATGVVKRPITT